MKVVLSDAPLLSTTNSGDPTNLPSDIPATN
eukprot:CAMPEP_0194334548 /NCGR_PEP_ID=MMETSP0171-20130528/66435_1 /TAXON_ID=218684 /ORGANISM="Corethron pennatum, Strain L29A3" /LENGTH=30 /DNA_ID= /DNA_START= /DNA_END= /DNA_ORIENTATION=